MTQKQTLLDFEKAMNLGPVAAAAKLSTFTNSVVLGFILECEYDGASVST